MTTGRGIGWLTAGAVVVAVHAAAAAALLRQTAGPMPVAGSLVVELVPAPAAAPKPVPAPMFEVPPGDLPAITTPPDFPASEPIALLPLPDQPDLALIDPLPDQLAMRPRARPRSQPDTVKSAPTPERQPKAEAPRETRREPDRQPAKTPQPQRAAKVPVPQSAPAATGARRGNTPASATSGQSTRAAPANANWNRAAQSAVARHMKRRTYSRKGLTVRVSISVSSNGQVTGAALVASSGDGRVDAEVLGQLRRLTRLPAPDGPRQISVSFKVN